MKAPLYSREGNKKGEVVLNPEIYGQRVNERLLLLVRKAYAANQRSGTADTKTRKDVSGGGKKPWKQKGTGRARAGSIRSPIWRGGGTVFGPHPRDYRVFLPKTMRTKAIIAALSAKAEDKNLLLLEDVAIESAKTKEWAAVLKALPIKDKKALCVVCEIPQNLKRASRNMLSRFDVQQAKDLNAYHILQKEKLIIEKEALPLLEKRLLPEAEEAVVKS